MASAKTNSEKFSPFPGLRPFTPDERGYFFGRENESEEVARKLLKNRFVAVTGASGTGKSSLVMCGLLPKIRQLGENEDWQIIIMKPGGEPLENLGESIFETPLNTDRKKNSRDEILKLLIENPDGITDILRILSSGKNFKTLLFVDQFEELFRYGSPADGTGTSRVASKFINLLTNAVTGDNPDFYLVISIRSDLVAECSHYRRFTTLVNNSNFLVSRMESENFRQAIVEPIKSAGAEIDNDLVDLLLRELEGGPYQLIVLQHALMRTWMHWKEADEPDRPIDISDYRSIGTMQDAISRHADEIYESLGSDEREICEKVFKIITGIGSDNKGIRYPSNIRTLKEAIRYPGDKLLRIIDRFRNSSISILTPDFAIPLTDDTIVDLSHESLIHLWDRLQKWVDEEHASVQMYLHLSEASALYHQGKAGLLKPPELQIAVEWREKTKPTLKWAQKYNPAFERAMVYLRTSEKEFHELEEKKIRQHRWRLRKIRIISSFLGGIALIAALATVAAFISKFSADNRRKIAEIEKAEIARQKIASDNYAAVALKKSVTSDSTALAAIRREQMEKILRMNAENQVLNTKQELFKVRKESESAIQASILANSNADSINLLKNEAQRLRLISVAKSMSLRSLQEPDNSDLKALLAFQAYLFNSKNRGSRNDADIYMGLYKVAKVKGSTKIKTYSGPETQVRSIAFVPGRNEFYASDLNGRILKWDLKNNQNSFSVVLSGNEIFNVLAVSPKSDWLACGGMNSNIRMLPLEGTGGGYELKGHGGSIKSLIFSYDGKYLYSAAMDGRVIKWDLKAQTSVDLATDLLHITSIEISSNNSYFAGINDQGKALIWNPQVTSDKFRIESSDRKIRSIKFRPDEERIAVGYDNGTVELWDIVLKKKISEFQAHEGEVNEMRFNSRMNQLATTGNDGLIKLWDTDDINNIPVSFNDIEGPVITMEFSPDGEVLLFGTAGKQPQLASRPAFADSFAADGCAYVTRNFTTDEWLAYIGKDIAYEKTCPENEFRIRIREVR